MTEDFRDKIITALALPKNQNIIDLCNDAGAYGDLYKPITVAFVETLLDVDANNEESTITQIVLKVIERLYKNNRDLISDEQLKMIVPMLYMALKVAELSTITANLFNMEEYRGKGRC